MEVHEQAVRRRILENVLIVRDDGLSVAAEEIDLHAGDAELSQT